jgi:hypothetical protein
VKQYRLHIQVCTESKRVDESDIWLYINQSDSTTTTTAGEKSMAHSPREESETGAIVRPLPRLPMRLIFTIPGKLAASHSAKKLVAFTVCCYIFLPPTSVPPLQQAPLPPKWRVK